VLDFESIQGATEFLDSYHDTAHGHIHIIIDGFNEENIPENQYYAVFGNVLDIIEHFNSYNWLNFTFIVRRKIYEKLKKRLPPIYYDAWLRVAPSVQDRDPLSDRIQFSTIELSQLFVRHRINHTIEELALSSNYTWLRIPRYLESYPRLNKQYPNIDFR